MKIRFKKLNPNAVMPKRAHSTDAGFDLVATSKIVSLGDAAVAYGTGIAVEIPPGYVGLVFPRSSIVGRDITLTNCVGVIDSGYRGEIKMVFKPALWANEHISMKSEAVAKIPPSDRVLDTYDIGERIGQIIIMPIPDIEWEESDQLSTSERGTGGYGSTGK